MLSGNENIYDFTYYLERENQGDDVRDRILEQVIINLWNNSSVVSLYSLGFYHQEVLLR